MTPIIEFCFRVLLEPGNPWTSIDIRPVLRVRIRFTLDFRIRLRGVKKNIQKSEKNNILQKIDYLFNIDT